MADQLPDGVTYPKVGGLIYELPTVKVETKDKSGTEREETVLSRFNVKTGNFDLYVTENGFIGLGGSNKLFATYNASTNELSPNSKNKEIYQRIAFRPSTVSAKTQLSSIVYRTKKATIGTLNYLIKDNDEHPLAPTLNTIAGYEGYKAIPGVPAAKSNVVQTPNPVVLDSDPPPPVVLDTNSTGDTGDTNSALPPEDGQTSTPLTENDLRDNVNAGRREGTFGENVSLQYPIYIPKELKYDLIQISPYAYVPAGLGFNPTAAEDRYKNVEKLLGTVTLPMQPNFSESNSVDWGGDMLNAVQSELGKGALGAINKGSTLDIKGAIDALANSGMMIIDKFSGDPTGKQFLAAYFAGQAVKASITGRSAGAVINPNLELLFNGPKLRTFSFSFKLTPRSANEAIMVRKIIKFFKKNMAAQRSTTNLFLLSPNVFKLKYISGFNKEQNPYMNKIKPCALSAFNVNYTPDGSYMTYNDPNNPSMTSYDIGLSFSEIEPIYADEIDYATNDMSY